MCVITVLLQRISHTASKFLSGNYHFVFISEMFLQDGVQIISAGDIEEGPRLSTGSVRLDELLRGGLPSQGIVEIAGESGCGKSQLCQQLTLTVQYPVSDGGFEGGAVYICTEGRFPSNRLHQLIQNFPKHYYKHNNNNNNNIDFGENILVVQVGDFDSLDKCLKKVKNVVSRRNIKLLIIDSIAGIFRGNYETNDLTQRTQDLRTTGNILHNLSFNYNLLVVCVNQVTQSLSDGSVIPALGLAWANIVTTRLMLTRRGTSRFMEVVFSPELPSKIVTEFSIQSHGVE